MRVNQRGSTGSVVRLLCHQVRLVRQLPPLYRMPLLLLLLLLLQYGQQVHAEFNYEVEKRVLERIDELLNGPRIANGVTDKMRSNGGFPHHMDARDRDAYLTLSYGLMQEFRFDMVYVGLEDGTFIGHGIGWGTYREPNNDGYKIADIMPPTTTTTNNNKQQQQHKSNSTETVERKFEFDNLLLNIYNYDDPTGMRKYFDACVDRATGQAQNCTLDVGTDYIQCVRNCNLMKCEDEQTQLCSSLDSPAVTATTTTALTTTTTYINDTDSSTATSSSCKSPMSTKWCRQYEVVQVTPEEQGKLGYIPRTYYCHDAKGAFTQDPGKAVKEGFLEEYGSPNIVLGDCEYDDGTKVERYEPGPFAYCNNNLDDDGFCDNTFDGGYRSRPYDPRYRGWYTDTKKTQAPNWSPPYPFFSNLDLGITYSQPIYSEDTAMGRFIFEGVLAVDYTFVDIGKFLQDSYMESSTLIVVFEEAEPNFMVASSTGRKSALKVMADDESQPCLDDSAGEDECTVVRERMSQLVGSPKDSLLSRAYFEQRSKKYPRELLTIKGNEDDGEEPLYIVQSSFYRPGGALDWIILVISPAGQGEADSLTPGDSLFGLVCVVASVGFFLCLTMFYLFFRQRHKRAIILADWRFTSAFLLGCAFLNLTSFTLLGENTDALCMLRIWAFHFLFVVALAPLFVKVWRMWSIVGSPNRRPTVVNNMAAVLLCLPIVAVQVLILIISSLADPPHQEEIIGIQDGIVTQHVVCSQESPAFSIITIIFEAGLVLGGCVLAYLTRNMGSQFGESKQLTFSMYNIAFIGIITTVIIYTMDIDAPGQIILRAIGVFWGTVFSSAAFVLPRLMRVKREKRRHHHHTPASNRKQTKPTKNDSNNKNVVGTGRPNSVVRFSMHDDEWSDDDESGVEDIENILSGSSDVFSGSSQNRTSQSQNPSASDTKSSQATDKKSNSGPDKDKSKSDEKPKPETKSKSDEEKPKAEKKSTKAEKKSKSEQKPKANEEEPTCDEVQPKSNEKSKSDKATKASRLGAKKSLSFKESKSDKDKKAGVLAGKKWKRSKSDKDLKRHKSDNSMGRVPSAASGRGSLSDSFWNGTGWSVFEATSGTFKKDSSEEEEEKSTANSSGSTSATPEESPVKKSDCKSSKTTTESSCTGVKGVKSDSSLAKGRSAVSDKGAHDAGLSMGTGTGWSVYETPDPNEELGNWDDEEDESFPSSRYQFDTIDEGDCSESHRSESQLGLDDIC